VILVDTNIFMYAGGAAHRRKDPCVRLLERIASGRLEAAIDAEVLQEILHRYRAIGRWETGRVVFDMARVVMPTVIPITLDHLLRCRRLLDENPRLDARDALHVGVYEQVRAEALCSYDEDFDAVPSIVRRTAEALIDS
jgi:predicted nucleic acid-binding protein